MGASSPLSFWIRTGAPRQVPSHVARHGPGPRQFTTRLGHAVAQRPSLFLFFVWLASLTYRDAPSAIVRLRQRVGLLDLVGAKEPSPRDATFVISARRRAVASVRYHESPHDPSGAFM